MDIEGTGAQTRKRFRDLEPASSDANNKSFAEYISAAPVTPLGHFEATVGTTPVGLPSIPVNAKRAVIYAVTAALTFTDIDGDSPSASHGMIIPSGVHFIYDTEPSDDFLMRADTNTDVRIAYYG